MTTVHYHYCGKCRKPLDYGLAYLKAGELVADCKKCGSIVCLERDVRCRVCGKSATQFFTKGVTPVIPFFFCDEHFTSYDNSAKRARSRAGAYLLPIIGTGLIVLSFLDKSDASGSSPFLPFLLGGVFCWALGIGLWKKLRSPSEAPPDIEADETDPGQSQS